MVLEGDFILNKHPDEYLKDDIKYYPLPVNILINKRHHEKMELIQIQDSNKIGLQKYLSLHRHIMETLEVKIPISTL